MDSTPRERDGSPASTRERILRSAAALFPGGRVRVTGVDALIAHAGVAKATRRYRACVAGMSNVVSCPDPSAEYCLPPTERVA